MPERVGKYWRRLSRVEQIFLVLAAVYALLYAAGAGGVLRPLAFLAMLFFGLLALVRLARRSMRKAIWRLRNRLVLAYLFIAVVPVVLILALVGIAAYTVVGQMAAYLVNTELNRRINFLSGPAQVLVRSTENPQLFTDRFAPIIQGRFQSFEILIRGKDEMRYPAGSTLAAPPAAWKNADGLVVRGGRVYAWVHALANGNEITMVAPVTHELLSQLVPGLGDVDLAPYTAHVRQAQLPPKQNALDFEVRFPYPVQIASWDSPQDIRTGVLLVTTRYSAVLGTVFGQKMQWGEIALGLFVALSILFLVVELVSLVAGVRLSRTITSAVHELYQGTMRVKEGDFAYRIPVRGDDQLAELSGSFNTMTENLGRLIVVAKENERLQSELAIAREVQAQLFPKDTPSSKTLQLAGVCRPARSVSGDYYDFISLSERSVAFAIGDVAGKGISAALLMAAIQSNMRTQLSMNGSLPEHHSTASLVAILNRQLYANTAPEKYATFYFALYDDSRHALTYTNAGHLPPFLMRGGEIQQLEPTGTVVGAFPFAQYGEQTVPLEPGDILVAYTDGLIEPENAYGEMFGEERLKDLLLKYADAESSEMIGRAMEAVVAWTGSSELQDDMTMLVARRV